MNTILQVLCFFTISVNIATSAGLNEEFTWTRINYDWSRFRNSRQSRQTGKSLNSGGIQFPGETNGGEDNQGGGTTTSGGNPPENVDYQFENNIPMGANVWKNKLFITVPRRRLGVPSTLNYVPLNSKNKQNVPLIPYPNAQINSYQPQNRDTQNFVSVYRVGVDPCDRLWFVDTGMIELPGNVTQVQPPTLIIMDLNTDQVIQRYVFPPSDLRPNTNLASITLDVTKETCGDAYAYMPDLAGYGLVVYSLRDNQSWRVTHNYFFLEPKAGEFFISGHNFQWNDGVFSVELTDVKPDGTRDLYFHSMAGTHLYRVSTRVLKNQTMATRSYHQDDFEIVGDKGEQSQASAADLHKATGVLFMGLVNQNALGCWKIGSKARDFAIVQKDDMKMIYPCDVKVYKDKVYLLTNTMPEFLYGRLNYDIINFRVWSKDVKEAVKSTKCAEKTGGRY